MWQSLIELLFPKRCIYCKSWGELLCSDCLDQLEYLEKQYCPACSQTTVLGLSDHGCGKRTYLDQVYSLVWFRGPARAVVNRYKFSPEVTALQSVIGRLISRGFDWEGLDFWEGRLVVPVPLHSRRRRERGFNQSEQIAQLLAQRLGSDCWTDWLIRQYLRAPQSSLSKRERQANVRGVFALAPRTNGKKYLPHVVILVDDVFTTGHTLQECARILKQEGKVEKVYGFTLARG